MTINLYEWKSESFPFSENQRSGLQAYLEVAWMNRPLLYKVDNEKDTEEPGEPVQRFIDFKSEIIKARNYVGFIQYGDIRINIQPKVFEGQSLLNEGDKIWHILKWLSYSQRFNFPFLESSFNSDFCTHDWLEAFIFLFANFTEKTLCSTPYLSYQELTEETSYIKGRLSINDYVQQNLAKGRHQNVYSTYEPFVYDNLFNRIVKHTCKYLSGITQVRESNQLLEQIIFLLDEVEDQFCTASDCEKVPVSHMFSEIEKITNLCKLFLANQSYTTNNSDANNLCILLPMEVIFEEFVFGFIQKHFSIINPRRQVSDMYFAQTCNFPVSWVFQMKHDILLDKLIIDTKYKFRELKRDMKSGVDQNDLYQIVSYCYRRNIKNSLLLYPDIVSANNEKATFKISAYNDESNEIKVDVASLDIISTEGVFEDVLKMRVEFLHTAFCKENYTVY